MKMKIGRHEFTGTNFRRLLNQPALCAVTPGEAIWPDMELRHPPAVKPLPLRAAAAIASAS